MPIMQKSQMCPGTPMIGCSPRTRNLSSALLASTPPVASPRTILLVASDQTHLQARAHSALTAIFSSAITHTRPHGTSRYSPSTYIPTNLRVGQAAHPSALISFRGMCLARQGKTQTPVRPPTCITYDISASQPPVHTCSLPNTGAVRKPAGVSRHVHKGT